MKQLLLSLLILSSITVGAKAELSITIKDPTTGTEIVATNPTGDEIVRLQSIQMTQLLIQLASKGCNKKGILDTILNRK